MRRFALLILSLNVGCMGVIDGASDQRVDGGDDIVPPADAGSRADANEGGLDPLCVTSATLNLRSEPSTDAAILVEMPSGAEVTPTGKRGGTDNAWLEVSHMAMQGWVFADYVGECVTGMGAGFNFLLPYAAGQSFEVSQGHNSGGSHTDAYNAWAWDFSMGVGTPLYAVSDGVVRLAKFTSNSFGCAPGYLEQANYVIIQRSDGVEAMYLHLQHIAAGQEPVTTGQTIKRGDFIGYSGQTGWTCGAHLHFQFQKGPNSGGVVSHWNHTVQQDFWDTGAPVDPGLGDEPVSANGPNP